MSLCMVIFFKYTGVILPGINYVFGKLKPLPGDPAAQKTGACVNLKMCIPSCFFE